MNWTEALTACGFLGDPRKENYYFEHGDLFWKVMVIPLWSDKGRFKAALSQGCGSESNCHEIARAEGDTADRAFMALLNEKVGPGGVSVFAFIGAERTAKVVLNAAFQVLRAVKENQGDEPARKQPDPNVAEWIKERLS